MPKTLSFMGHPLTEPMWLLSMGYWPSPIHCEKSCLTLLTLVLICPGFVVSELGPPEYMQYGMPTDQFMAMIIP